MTQNVKSLTALLGPTEFLVKIYTEALSYFNMFSNLGNFCMNLLSGW